MGLNGSSNYISRAGAIGALGGDLTAASYNPAGLGLFNSNELSMSTGFYGSFYQCQCQMDFYHPTIDRTLI